MRTQFMTLLGLAAAVAGSASVQASTQTVRGVTFKTENAVTTGVIPPSGGSYPNPNGYSTPNGQGLYNNKDAVYFFDASGASITGTTAHLFRRASTNPLTTGQLAPEGTSITLGLDDDLVGGSGYPFTSTHLRDVIQLSWNNTAMVLKNKNGNNVGGQDVELAIFEQASPEAFAVRVRREADQTFTNWYYNFASARTNNNSSAGSPGHGSVTFFDLALFGIGTNVNIDMVELINLRPTDIVSNANGSGFVTFSDTVNLAGNKPRLSANGAFFAANAYDPDIEYVVAMRDIEVGNNPEPGSLAILTAGIGAAALRRRRTRRQDG